jgi:hypothetical protein
MPRPTQQEIDEWNARMNEPEESEDDYEVWIKTPEGVEMAVPYSRAKNYLGKYGISLDPVASPDPNPGENPESGNPQNSGGGQRRGYFSGRQSANSQGNPPQGAPMGNPAQGPQGR